MVEPQPDLIERPLGAARAQVHETYIVAQTRDGLVIVDQHAAHERIVYERLKAAIDKSGVARQILLIPEIVELDEGDAARLVARAEDLARFGLVIEAFGPGAVAVRKFRRCSARSMCKGWCAISRRYGGMDDQLPLERVGSRLGHHGVPRHCTGRAEAQAGRDECAASRDGSDAQFRPV